MPHLNRVLVLFAIGALFVRCASEVIIDLPEEPAKIVAVGDFTAGQTIGVRVTLSQPIHASGPPEVPTQAEVIVSNGGLFWDRLRAVYSENGELYWESRDLAESGKAYSLSVRVPGYETAEADSYVPVYSQLVPPLIDPAAVKTIDLDDGRKALRIPLVLHVERMPRENRYFAFRLRHGTDVYVRQGDELVFDHTYVSDSTFFLADGRTLSLLHNLVEPVVLINENMWDDNNRKIQIDVLVPYSEPLEKPRRLYVEWRTLSEQYYKYHLSLTRQGNQLPLSDPDAVYNNIINGYGNFSGYATGMDTVAIPF